jgi:6-phosphogluconolactonase
MSEQVRRTNSLSFHRHVSRLLVAVAILVAAVRPASAQSEDYYLYFGTYTGFKFVSQSATHGVGDARSKGIYVSRFHTATGVMDEPQLAAETINPSFLTVHPNHHFLYSVSEDPLSLGPPLDHASYVSAFAIDAATGKLRLLNTLPTGGTSTCHISMDNTGKFVFMANFGSGSVTVLRVKEDGSLGEQAAFVQHLGHGLSLPIQSGPHPHTVRISADNKYLVVSDLGIDKVLVYRFDDTTGMLSPLEPPSASVDPGDGPRRFIFDPAGKFGYQLNELGSTLITFAFDPANGTLTKTQQQTIMPQGFNRDNGAEMQISTDGKFLYQSNRLARLNAKDPKIIDRLTGTIALYAIDPQSHKLTLLEQFPSGGIMPRSFGIDPTGQYLFALHQITNNVVQFKVDRTTGKLTPTGREIKVDTPVCLQFVPAGV